MRQILNPLHLKLVIESELQSIKTYLAKATLKIDHGKYLWLILC